MMTPHDYECLAIAASKRLGMRVFFRKGIKNHATHYEIFRRTPAGKVTLLKTTGSAQALASYLTRQEAPTPKASSAKPFAVRKNPASRFRDEGDAAHLAQQFHGRAPLESEYEIVDMPKLPDSMAAIGPVAAIEYIALRDGKEYRFRHEFKVRSRPALAVSPDGKFVSMLGGAWHFTEDGFEDL